MFAFTLRGDFPIPFPIYKLPLFGFVTVTRDLAKTSCALTHYVLVLVVLCDKTVRVN